MFKGYYSMLYKILLNNIIDILPITSQLLLLEVSQNLDQIRIMIKMLAYLKKLITVERNIAIAPYLIVNY